MAIQPFLAMTAGEIQGCSAFPEKTAWMACHFSSYGTGLSNLPTALPPDSLLILNDRTPIRGHDPERIARQLTDCLQHLECRGLLLDFQRPGNGETAELVKMLTDTLPCPVGVSEPYAGEGAFPVFVPPIPPSTPLAEYLTPWTGREIWLELALDGEVITLTEQGCEITPLLFGNQEEGGFQEETLHCHYQIRLEEAAAKFTLWRTREDLEALVETAEKQGITTAIGLYQEFNRS